MTISCSPLRTFLVSSTTLLCKTKYFDYVNVSTTYTIRDCQQITFVAINRFCPLRFLGSFLIINIPSTSLAVYLGLLSALLYWGLWLIYWSSFWKAFSVSLSFFTISNSNILYLFPEICHLSDSLWSEAPFSVL